MAFDKVHHTHLLWMTNAVARCARVLFFLSFFFCVKVQLQIGKDQAAFHAHNCVRPKRQCCHSIAAWYYQYRVNSFCGQGFSKKIKIKKKTQISAILVRNVVETVDTVDELCWTNIGITIMSITILMKSNWVFGIKYNNVLGYARVMHRRYVEQPKFSSQIHDRVRFHLSCLEVEWFFWSIWKWIWIQNSSFVEMSWFSLVKCATIEINVWNINCRLTTCMTNELKHTKLNFIQVNYTVISTRFASKIIF